jgi:hypothetical protein
MLSLPVSINPVMLPEFKARFFRPTRHGLQYPMTLGFRNLTGEILW